MIFCPCEGPFRTHIKQFSNGREYPLLCKEISVKK